MIIEIVGSIISILILICLSVDAYWDLMEVLMTPKYRRDSSLGLWSAGKLLAYAFIIAYILYSIRGIYLV